jgi:hypothetical protein
MPIYRFRILDKSGRVIAGQYSHCVDDEAARANAKMLVEQVRGLGIEASCDTRQMPRTSAAGNDHR